MAKSRRMTVESQSDFWFEGRYFSAKATCTSSQRVEKFLSKEK